jgi:hypothetical protein
VYGTEPPQVAVELEKYSLHKDHPASPVVASQLTPPGKTECCGLDPSRVTPLEAMGHLVAPGRLVPCHCKASATVSSIGEWSPPPAFVSVSTLPLYHH